MKLWNKKRLKLLKLLIIIEILTYIFVTTCLMGGILHKNVKVSQVC